MPTSICDYTFFTSFSESAAYGYESVQPYGPTEIDRLHFDFRAYVDRQLGNLYRWYSECFNLAEYPDIQDEFDDAEVAILRDALGASPDVDIRRTQLFGQFDALAAVIMHRLEDGSLPGMRRAALLFNLIVSHGLLYCEEYNRNPESWVRIDSFQDFAPFAVRRALFRLRKQLELPGGQTRRDGKATALIEALEIIEDELKEPEWMQNGLTIRLARWASGLYESLVNDAR